MINNAYKETIAQQIAAKQVEIQLLKQSSIAMPIIQRVLNRVTIDRLEQEIETLIHLLKEEETVPTKEDILKLIDESLDKHDEEEFMRLTNLLKSMNKE